MSFINQALLYGLAAVSIPIILHLLNRRSAKQIQWGAMQFLLDSVEQRRKRIQLEEALLLAARCLLVGLLALTVARPFQPPGGKVPYVVVLPAFLISLVMITTGIILRGNRKWLITLVGGGLLLLIASGVTVAYERYWNLKRFGHSGRKDIVLIIDGSTSMQLKQGGTSNFDRAVAEAKEVLDKSTGGNAFSVILGGPVPLVKIGDPIVNKNDLELTLNSLKPVRGKMDAFGALATALTALNRGANPNKEIILFSDGQSIGWNLDSRSAWEALKQSADQLTTRPPIILRRFPLPKHFRNIAASSLRLSREVVGTDRPVGIDITLENTGNEAVTPSGIEVTVGYPPKAGQASSAASAAVVLKETKIGQLAPGARETVHFSHKFSAPGSWVISAKLAVQDDLALDDATETVAHVVDRLKVLVVEGSPNSEVFNRGSAFAALALLPTADLTSRTPTAPPAQEPKPKPGAMIEPEVVPHTRLVGMGSFAPYDVVILCGVPRLNDTAARRLAAWVQSGGGLLIAPSGESDAAFYNNWKTVDGAPLPPGQLAAQAVFAPGKDAAGLALNTFTHAALKLVADAKQSDLGTAVLQRYWRLGMDGPEGADAFVAGRLTNGDPFLTGRRCGFGMVMLSAAAFDAAGGNLATRQAFVPLIHQLVYQLNSPEGQPLQREPAQQLNIPISGATAEGGLKGEYFRGRNFKDPAYLIRIDPATAANFDEKPPAPGLPREDFSVRWTGALVPKYTDDYIFEGWGDDRIDVWLEGAQIIKQSGNKQVKLEAGRFYPLRIDYEQSNGNARYELYWRTSNGQFQQREIIPLDALTPFPPGSEEKEIPVGALPVTGPDGAERKARLLFTRGGLMARIGGDIIPGTYKMRVPKDRQSEYRKLLDSEGNIPFSVNDDASESRLVQFSDRDTEFLKSHFELLQPKDAAEITNILAGRQFGEELWKYLAVGALFILLAEIALTRWITLNRRSGEETTLDFENRFQAPKQFQEQVEKLQKIAAN
ncbi:MAG: BatA domain-containing protein [Verrucomicrobiales bacterium]|nr:BatA domain-containing protein [Verrucomicrobiales bacterium]